MIEMIDKNNMEEIDLTEIINRNTYVSMILFEDDAREIIESVDDTLTMDEESENCEADIVILSRVGNEIILEPLIHENNQQFLNDTDVIYYDVDLVDIIDFEKLYANEIIEIEFDYEMEEIEEVEEIYNEIIEELLANYDNRQAMREMARISYEDGRKTLALELSEKMNEIVEE